jgi:hypothetical protein
MGKSRRRENRRVGSSEIVLRKRRGGKEQRRKGVGDRNKTIYLYFFGVAVLYVKKL